jgi:hypothetical protein
VSERSLWHIFVSLGAAHCVVVEDSSEVYISKFGTRRCDVVFAHAMNVGQDVPGS